MMYKKKYHAPMRLSFGFNRRHHAAITAGNLLGAYPIGSPASRCIPADNSLTSEVLTSLGVHGGDIRKFQHVTYYYTDPVFDIEWERDDIPFFLFFISHRVKK